MKSIIIKTLLRILNTQWLNPTPCVYKFVGNIDAFEYSHLQSEESQRTGITVRQILDEADAFRSCPIRKTGLTVIEDGTVRDADCWDIKELTNLNGR